MTRGEHAWDEGAFQLAINQALEKLNDANAKLACRITADAKPKLSTCRADIAARLNSVTRRLWPRHRAAE